MILNKKMYMQKIENYARTQIDVEKTTAIRLEGHDKRQQLDMHKHVTKDSIKIVQEWNSSIIIYLQLFAEAFAAELPSASLVKLRCFCNLNNEKSICSI